MDNVIMSTWGGKLIDTRKAPRNTTTLPGIPRPATGEPVAALMGWNGLVVMDPRADIVALSLNYLKAIRTLSCGECSVCMIGIDRLIDIITGIQAGDGSRKDLKEITEIVAMVSLTAKCSFGQSALAPLKDALKHCKDVFGAAITAKPAPDKETRRYASRLTAPCMDACPATIDIPGYIELIKNNRFADSLELIRQNCILPGVIGRVCTHPCEQACVRSGIDEPLSIRLLKRAAADTVLAEGGGALKAPATERTERIAVIGAGPAGLAAAYRLRRRGYQVSVFESLPQPGGMAVVGIPSYRLPRDILTHEIDLIKRMGVEIRVNTPMEALNITTLKKQGFAAVFVAVGAHRSNPLGIEGEDQGYEGFLDGVALLRTLQLGGTVPPTGKVVIVGGGNVAMDCARSCVRLGFKEVAIIYRRSRAEMPASDEEIDEAGNEGITLTFLTAPIEVLAENGAVTGVVCQAMKLGTPDESGRRRPVPVPGSEFTIDTDTIVSAIGQRPVLPLITGSEPVEITPWGTLTVDPVTLMTGADGVFAGGDCVTGPGILIEALDMGNRAAEGIDAYLRGASVTEELSFDGVELTTLRTTPFVAPRPAQHVSLLAAGARSGNFHEVEGPLSPGQAISEAKRCLRCYRVVVWEQAG